MLSVLSLFSGIGAFEQALTNLGIPYTLNAFCEFDTHAVRSYCAIHGVDGSKNLGDVTKVDASKLQKDIDVLTYGFPCQDISLAGKQGGMFNDDGSKTRSGLSFEALRIIETVKPKIAIAENVKNIISKRFMAQFNSVLEALEAAGYNNYWAVLNATGFGVPQKRERVIVVSIRRDLDDGSFRFPKPFPLMKRLKDVMDSEVESKYHLPVEMYSQIAIDRNCAVPSGELAPKVLGGIGEKKSNRGTQWYQQNRIYDDTIAISLATKFHPWYFDRQTGNVRKLTPRECFRLMGFDDEAFNRAQAVNNDRQLYKQAGNSIVVNVLEHLFCQLIDDSGNLCVINNTIAERQNCEKDERKNLLHVLLLQK